ncbi:MAG: hypothetical protein A07HB70_00618 [uncultured archaeon A07HB70]|nr:MAG: hypothetical protein A07HB70_00618 [uncultured archaeon A07HB70]
MFCDGDADGYQSGDGGPVLQVDLTSSKQIEYDEPEAPSGSGDPPFLSDGSGTLRDDFAANEHGHSLTLEEGDTEKNVSWVTNHYVAFLPSRFTLKTNVDPGSNNANAGNNVGVEEPESKGVLRYDTGLGNGFIRFLHVTENEIEVRVSA